jgi:hypothetical protein
VRVGECVNLVPVVFALSSAEPDIREEPDEVAAEHAEHVLFGFGIFCKVA